MKKTMKKLIALAVVFVMLLTAVPAFASGQSCIYGEDTVSAVFYPNQKMHNQYFGTPLKNCFFILYTVSQS